MIYLGPQAQAIVGRWLRTDLTAYLFSPRDAVEERLAARRRNRRTPMTPSQRARKRKPRPRRSPGKHYDVAAYGHAIAKGCDRAFPHPTLDPIPREERTDEQRAELRAWRQAHRWHPNQLRHNAATKIRKRYGLEASQVVLGHASADITQTYAERDLAAARRIMGEIG